MHLSVCIVSVYLLHGIGFRLPGHVTMRPSAPSLCGPGYGSRPAGDIHACQSIIANRRRGIPIPGGRGSLEFFPC